MRRLMSATVLLLWPTLVCGQTLINPTRVEWTHSPQDYQGTTRYELGWYLSAEAPAPVQVLDVVPETPCVGTPLVLCTTALPVRPALGSWVIRLRAWGVDQALQPVPSGWSAPSNPFTTLLLAPSPTVRP